MQTIYKYELEVSELQEIYMPQGAGVLDVQNQNGKICVWAEVDTEAIEVKYTFAIFGTGQELRVPYENCKALYCGTIQFYGYVWHVYQIV